MCDVRARTQNEGMHCNNAKRCSQACLVVCSQVLKPICTYISINTRRKRFGTNWRIRQMQLIKCMQTNDLNNAMMLHLSVWRNDINITIFVSNGPCTVRNAYRVECVCVYCGMCRILLKKSCGGTWQSYLLAVRLRVIRLFYSSAYCACQIKRLNDDSAAEVKKLNKR